MHSREAQRQEYLPVPSCLAPTPFTRGTINECIRAHLKTQPHIHRSPFSLFRDLTTVVNESQRKLNSISNSNQSLNLHDEHTRRDQDPLSVNPNEVEGKLFNWQVMLPEKNVSALHPEFARHEARQFSSDTSDVIAMLLASNRWPCSQ
jgi:hypothetical protein